MKRAAVRMLCVVGLCLGCTPGLKAIEPLVTNYGIGSILHPLQEPRSIGMPNGCDGASCHKEHVYIFGVNGWNPLCLGNFNGLLGYIRKQGFPNVYFGQLHTSHTFAGHIREIYRCDPHARIVLIGFSGGANYVKWIANALTKDNVKIDLLVYLVGDTVPNTPASHPANVCRVVNVRAKGLILTGGDLFFNGEDMDGARNVHLECRHILAPSRCETIEVVMQELMPLACQPVAAPAVAVPAPPPAPPLAPVAYLIPLIDD
jgi:hypothetical protein